MATVRNVSPHSVTLDPGPSLAPKDTAACDTSLPFNAQLLDAGLIVVTDGAPVPPLTPWSSGPVSRVVVSTNVVPDQLPQGVLYIQTNEVGEAVTLGVNLS